MRKCAVLQGEMGIIYDLFKTPPYEIILHFAFSQIRVILSVLQSAANLLITILAGGKYTLSIGRQPGVEEASHCRYSQIAVGPEDSSIPLRSTRNDAVCECGELSLGITRFLGSA